MSKLSIFSVKPKPIVLEGGSTVYIRRLSGAERVEWLESVSKPEAQADNALGMALEESARLIATSLHDEKGARIFSDNEIADVKQIDAQVIDSIVREIFAFNGMTTEAKDDLAKKSESGAPTTASSPSSPAPSE